MKNLANLLCSVVVCSSLSGSGCEFSQRNYDSISPQVRHQNEQRKKVINGVVYEGEYSVGDQKWLHPDDAEAIFLLCWSDYEIDKSGNIKAIRSKSFDKYLERKDDIYNQAIAKFRDK